MAGKPIRDEELSAFVDRELSPEQSIEVEAWLSEHPGDAARLDAWRAQDDAIRAAFDPILNEPLPARLAALGKGVAAPDRRWAARWATATAAALIVFGAGFAAARIGQPAQVVQEESLGEYGLEAHSVYAGEVRHPVEVTAAEEDHLVRWLSKRLDAQLVVPNLTGDGLTLVGGRLLPAAGKPCAMLMYEAQSGERFTLLVVHGGNEGDTAFRYQEDDGYGSYSWRSGSFGYALTGPADKTKLLDISRQVYEALS